MGWRETLTPGALSAERPGPASIEAEQALLGALLANSRVVERIEEILQPVHFADELHGEIYRVICEMTSVGRAVSAVSVAARFPAEALADEVLPGVPLQLYFGQLLAAMVGALQAGEYAQQIREAWYRRSLLALADDTTADVLRDGSASGAELAERVDARLLALATTAGETGPNVRAGFAVTVALDDMRAAISRGSRLAGLSTGLTDLDRMTNGLMPGCICLIGARPSMGKTALGLTIAARAARVRRVYFWSGEMAAHQLGARLAAAHAGLSVSSVFSGLGFDRFPDGEEEDLPPPRPLLGRELDAFSASQEAAQELNLEIDDRAGLTVAAIRARTRRMRRAREGLGLVVLDYVGLMRAPAGYERLSRYEQMTEISRQLVELAKELQVPVLALAQLNRASESREDKRPTMADLRDSGALEQDATQVLLLHRPHYYLSRQSRPEKTGKESEEDYAKRVNAFYAARKASFGHAEVIVHKNRHGPTGATRLRYQDHTTWFRGEDEEFSSPAW